MSWGSIFAASLLALLIFLFLPRLLRRDSYPFHARTMLLSPAELSFFQTLQKALPTGLSIAPKVRLGDVIGCSDADWTRGHGPRISAKHLDFVLFETASSRIRLAVELDDATHDRPERKQRDDFLNRALAAAAVPLLRVKTARGYNLQDLKQNIESHLENDSRQRQ